MRQSCVLVALAVLSLPLAPAPGQPPYRPDQLDLRNNAMIDGWYRRYLRRPAESYRAEAVAMLRAGTARETVLASILASPEYYNLAGGDERRFIPRLVADVTGRTATPREVRSLFDRMRREERSQAIYEFLMLHPEGLSVPETRPEPAYEYRREYHRDYDHDHWDERRGRRDR